MRAWTRWVAWMGCSAFITGCLGGQTGEVGPDGLGGQAQCPAEAKAPLRVKERFVGRYETAYATGDSTFTCAPVAGSLTASISFEDSDDDLELKPCGAAWYPVKVHLGTDDESLDQHVRGYLAEDGRLELEEVEVFEVYSQLDPDQRSLTLHWHAPDMFSVPACCLETSTADEHPVEVAEDWGVVPFAVSQTDAKFLGESELNLHMAVSTEDRSTCAETGAAILAPATITLLDDGERPVLELPGMFIAGEAGFEVGSATVKVDRFNAPELSPSVQDQIFGVSFHATLDTEQPSAWINLEFHADNTNREILLNWEGQP